MGTKVIAVTQRDKALLIVLPALAIFIGYTLIFAKQPLMRLKALEAQVEATQRKLPRPNEISDAEARIGLLQRRIQEADAQVLEIRATLSRIAVSGTNNLERLAGGEALSALWRRHGLVLTEQRETEEAAVGLPVPLHNLASRAQRFKPARVSRPWEVRLQGSFPQVQAALAELAESEIPALTVSLDMGDSTAGGTAKSWRIRIWQ